MRVMLGIFTRLGGVPGLLPFFLANLIVGVIFGTVGVLYQSEGPSYYQAVQEDGIVEWMTVWAFLAAAVVYFKSWIRQRNRSRRLEWFTLGLSLFCFLIAMEEISWGQRLFGYLPPSYFLENNFQQELNFHNLMDSSLRQWFLGLLIFGFGVFLPILALFSAVRKLLEKMQIIAPPILLIPAFLLTQWAIDVDSSSFGLESVEMLLGYCFVFAALLANFRPSVGPSSSGRTLGTLFGVSFLIFGLGLAGSALTEYRKTGNPLFRDALMREFQALSQDLQAEPNLRVFHCNLEERLYGYVERKELSTLFGGEFSKLTSQGMPFPRARYFLDPWNSTYWIYAECGQGGRRLFLYSYGPNRTNDTVPDTDLTGDDIIFEVMERPLVVR